LLATEFRQKYPAYPDYESGAWTFHHGLRHSRPMVRDYIRDKDIFDVGAYYGDSLMVLEQYTEKIVRSYELIPDSAATALGYARRMNMSRHVVNNIGLSDKAGWVNVPKRGDIASSMNSRGNVGVQITTIDEEVETLNISTGFIKIDIEGQELLVLKGAANTLRTQHPILSISSYHNVELMDIPKFLECEIGGYRIHFENEGDKIWNLYEQVILAFPSWFSDQDTYRP
jgi:FkbM family methyltransferase